MLSVMRLIPDPPGKIVDGEVIFYGRDLLKLSAEEMRRVRGAELAMVFQDPMTFLNPVLTVGFQVMEALKWHQGMDDRQARERTAELLTLVGIPKAADRLDDYPHQFSGGMRQRAMIAMALSCNPLLLIADEPTTALDVTIQAQIMELLDKINREHGTSIVLVTHNLGLVAEFCEKIIVMYAGWLMEAGSIDEVIDAPKHPYTAGLLGCLPRISEAREKIHPIPGLVPDLATLDPGCPFAPRCERARPTCSQDQDIPLLEMEGGRLVRCLYPLRAEGV
jgi:oligopeptide/dipeptide ABC transporter ATP-binding protein